MTTTNSCLIQQAKQFLLDKTPQPQLKPAPSTELYVWGNDNFGQLGLGHKYLSSNSKTNSEEVQKCPPKERKFLIHPKSCSFSIQISDVACGEDYAFLLTSKGLLYAMGNNQFGKLGIFSQKNITLGDVGNVNALLSSSNGLAAELNDSQVPFVNTPKLVETLSKFQITKVTCGLIHAVAIEGSTGTCFSWGSNSHGQLGRHTT